MEDAFLNLNRETTHPILDSMKEYAKQNKVPIISEEGLVYLKQLVRLKKVKRILEVGTAIGYSSIHLALEDSSIMIDTIERDPKMVEVALANIASAGLQNQIRVLHKDALEVETNELSSEYDLIFIDAAKAQYTLFFKKYGILLPVSGLVVTDNLLFHGLVESQDEIESKSLRALVRKIRTFNEWLANNPDYYTTFLKIGDGMAVSEKL